MKQIFSVIFLLLTPLGMYAQIGSDYYITDTATIIGVKILDYGNKSNCQFFYVQEEENKVQFFPDKIREYGFDNNRVYVSKQLYIDNKLQHVFIEKLTNGKKPLYYYRGNSELFLMETDSAYFVALPKKEKNKKTYKQRLKEITDDCPDADDAANFTGYNKKSLKRFLDWYDKCESRPFPHFRYGIRAGYQLYHLLAPPQSLKQFDFKYGGTFSLGLFMDAPVLKSDFLLNLGVNYSHRGYSYNNLKSDINYDFVANMSSLAMPVLVRYSFPTMKYRFFMQSGGIVEYNFNKDAYIYESAIYGNFINISRTEAYNIDEVRFGFSFGAGLEYRITRRNYLFLELSVNQLYGNIKNRDILFTIGLNI